jgi:hypothetical protein
MCLGVLGVNRLVPPSLPWAIRLAIRVLTGGVVYAGFILVFFRERVMRYANFISGLRSGKPAPEPAVT